MANSWSGIGACPLWPSVTTSTSAVENRSNWPSASLFLRSIITSMIGSNTNDRPWRGWPSESNAPALISDSIVRLFSTGAATRSQKS